MHELHMPKIENFIRKYYIPNPQVKTNMYAKIVRNNPKTKNSIDNKQVFLEEILSFVLL